jgi:hypothetical protein
MKQFRALQLKLWILMRVKKFDTFISKKENLIFFSDKISELLFVPKKV